MGILRADRITGLGGANAITGSTFFGGGVSAESGGASQNNLQLNLSSDFNLGTNNFTIEAFIYLEALGQFNNILAVGTDSTNGYRMDLGTGNNLRLVTKLGSDSWGVLMTGGTTFIAGKWYHVAVTRSGNSFDLWVDGTKDATTVTNSGSVLDATVNDANGGNNNIGVEIGSLSTYGYSRKFNGYISNLHLVNGTALYTSNYSIPTTRLEKRSDTVLLTCNSAGNILNEETGKTITKHSANTNSQGPVASRFTPNSPVGFSTTTDVGSQYGSTFDGFGSFATSTYMVPPGGNTRERNRGRGLVMGGGRTAPSSAGVNNITFIEIQSQGNAQDFGDLTEDDVIIGGSLASSTRGIRAGGHDPSPASNSNTIDFVTIANTGNATNFGDLIQASHWMQSGGSQTRGVMAGGNGGGNVIQYITIATAGDSQDFGDLINSYTTTVGSGNGAASPTRLLFAGGTLHPSPSATNIIQYVTIASTGDAVDFGDLTDNKTRFGVCSNATRGLYGGGGPAETDKTNTITFVTLASTGNTVDFGDRIVASNNVAATSNSTRGVFIGGGDPSATINTIDFVTIASTGNATDFGDNVTAIEHTSACSDSHGGIS